MEELDFSKNKMQRLKVGPLETLKESYLERQPGTDLPMGGISHYELLEWLEDLMSSRIRRTQLAEIFVVNNADRYRPGVSVMSDLVAQYGEKSPKVHCLRRVYANLIMDYNGGYWFPNVVVSYTQRGIAVGFGPIPSEGDLQGYPNWHHSIMSRCQTIMRAEHIFSNYTLFPGKRLATQAKTIEELKAKIEAFVDDWDAAEELMDKSVEFLRKQEAYGPIVDRVIARLVVGRVQADSKDPYVRMQAQYPLNNKQINRAVERILRWQAEKRKTLTMWQVLQLCNEDLNPAECDVPSILPQCYELTRMVLECAKGDYNGYIESYDK